MRQAPSPAEVARLGCGSQRTEIQCADVTNHWQEKGARVAHSRERRLQVHDICRDHLGRLYRG